MSVLWKIAIMQKQTALSLHANSTGVADAGSRYSVIYPLATCANGCQLGCTSTVSFVAPVSRLLF